MCSKPRYFNHKEILPVLGVSERESLKIVPFSHSLFFLLPSFLSSLLSSFFPSFLHSFFISSFWFYFLFFRHGLTMERCGLQKAESSWGMWVTRVMPWNDDSYICLPLRPNSSHLLSFLAPRRQIPLLCHVFPAIKICTIGHEIMKPSNNWKSSETMNKNESFLFISLFSSILP